MNKTHSNYFNMSTDSQSDIKNKDFVNIPTKTIDIHTPLPINTQFINELSSIKLSCKGYKGIEFEEINVDYSNFSDYHYTIMNNRYLIVLKDKDSDTFKYLTNSGKVFITADKKVIQIINNIPYPYKISINYIPLMAPDKYKSLQLLAKTLFNIDEDDPVKLIKNFLKPTSDIQTTNEYYINYYLFTIYPRIEIIINKYNYWKYICLEQEVFNINNSVLPYEIINFDYLTFIKDDYSTEIKRISEEINIDVSDIYNEAKLFESIYNNTEFYLTLNNDLVKILKNSKLDTLLEKIQTIRFIDYIDKYKSLPKCDIPSVTGTISSSISIKESINFSSKTLIRCNYKDLYYKILAFFSHNKQIKELAALDKNIVEELLKDEFTNEDQLRFYSFLIENYIIALNLGYENDEDILLYFEKELKTLIADEEYNYVKDLYNNKLPILKEVIDKYNSSDYLDAKTKLLHHIKLKPLGIAIYDKIRLIQKNLIVELNEYCKDFNEKNKSKMDIIYFDDTYIYVIVDEEALNTAFDTLTRIMPKTFSDFCPSITSNCIIEVLN